MSSSAVEFHRIWISQCDASADIRESFGLKNALDYLVGEKFLAFLMVSERDMQFAAELPAFVDRIRELFSTVEICDYLNDLERSRFFAASGPDLEIVEFDDEPWPANPVSGAEELLRFSRAKHLLIT